MKEEYYYNPKYMKINKKGYPVWKDNENRSLHRYVAEKEILKRKLKEGEEVHHVDGDKLNFTPDNLIVLSKEDHKKIEDNIRKHKNLNIASEIIFSILFFFLIASIGSYITIFGKIMLVLIVFIGMIIPRYPQILRKVLFKTGVLQRNDRNEKWDIDYIWNKLTKRKTNL